MFKGTHTQILSVLGLIENLSKQIKDNCLIFENDFGDIWICSDIRTFFAHLNNSAQENPWLKLIIKLALDSGFVSSTPLFCNNEVLNTGQFCTLLACLLRKGYSDSHMRINSFFKDKTNEIIESFVNKNKFNIAVNSDKILEILTKSLSPDIPDDIKNEIICAVQFICPNLIDPDLPTIISNFIKFSTVLKSKSKLENEKHNSSSINSQKSNDNDNPSILNMATIGISNMYALRIVKDVNKLKNDIISKIQNAAEQGEEYLEIS